MTLDILKDANFLTLLAEGFLSVFSPCVLPIIPLYLGYIMNSSKKSDGSYSKSKTFLLTFLFTLGICTTFIILGLGASFLQKYIQAHLSIFQLIGGLLLILMSLITFNVISIPFLSKFKFNSPDISKGVDGFKAWLMGFTFSFAFTPCVGPMLAQALILASQSASKVTGWLYIGAYSFGFIIVFLLLGLFTETILNFINKHKNVTKYTSIVAGIIILLSGLYMCYTGYTTLSLQNQVDETVTESTTGGDVQPNENKGGYTYLSDVEFTLGDIDGNQRSLTEIADGKGLVVYFSETWCQYCEQVSPMLINLQKEHGDKVQVVMINNLPSEKGKTKEEVQKHYEDKYGVNYPILYDIQGKNTYQWGVTGYPYLFFFAPTGEFLANVPGLLSEQDLETVIPYLDGTIKVEDIQNQQKED